MTTEQLLARARMALGRQCEYRLGRGGFDPSYPLPWARAKQCDCSGFVSWCLGVSRKTDNPYYTAYNGGWFETTAIVRDALARGVGMFDRVLGPDLPRPGDLYVWGDSKDPTTGKVSQGHVGIITAVDRLSSPTLVIHCSKGNERARGDAIGETEAAMFLARGAIVARCAWVVGP